MEVSKKRFEISPKTKRVILTYLSSLIIINCLLVLVDVKVKVFHSEATIGDKIVETLYSNRVTSEKIRIHTPSLSPPFKVGMFLVF